MRKFDKFKVEVMKMGQLVNFFNLFFLDVDNRIHVDLGLKYTHMNKIGKKT